MQGSIDQPKTAQVPKALWLLKMLLLVLGMTAFPSGILLLLDPSGRSVHFPEGALDGSPFTSYFIPGLLLTVCIGILPLTAWYALWKKPAWPFLQRLYPFVDQHWAWIAALKSGLALVIWISVQMTMVPYMLLQPVLLVWGWAIILLCFAPGIRAFYK